MHPSFEQIDHRPWPLPDEKWQWRQSWYDLCFIHYRIDLSELRSLIPKDLEIQEFEGSAWISIVPFRMFDVSRGKLPSIYPMRSFPELNLRTYVSYQGKPGVWFFSLDADCWPIVWGGQKIFGLPYHKAKMRLTREANEIHFTSQRNSVKFEANYEAVGEPFQAQPASFEHWIAERYCLYSLAPRGLTRVEVHHKAWPLYSAKVAIKRNDLFSAMNLKVTDESPRINVSPGVDVVSYKPQLI